MKEILSEDLLEHLRFYKASLEREGVIPTIEELIKRIEQSIVEDAQRISKDVN